MSAAPAVGELRCALIVATLTARGAARSGAVWGLLFGALLLARPLNRRAWLAGRLGFGAVFVIAAALATGLAAWAGIAGSGGLGLGPMLQAGLNLVPPALLILGLGRCCSASRRDSPCRSSTRSSCGLS